MELTDREHHRHNSEYTQSLIVKLFAFQFVNSCTSVSPLRVPQCHVAPDSLTAACHWWCADGSLFYIGFWLKDISRLGSQLGGIMITGQLIRVAREHLLLQACPPPTSHPLWPHMHANSCKRALTRAL